MSLEVVDPEMHALIAAETHRQATCVPLIASENFTSRAVREALGSVLTNKYSEGLPGARYYGGNEFIDEMERLAQKRCLEAFKLDPNTWGVNVQPYSGSPANFAVYTALLKPGDTLMGLDLPSGGHLTHGYQAPSGKKVSATSLFWNSVPYHVRADGLVDYDEVRTLATMHRPKIIICGGSAYSRDWNYTLLREIASSGGAYLMCDMAHTAGLIAAGLLNNPFDVCDVVTTTTHKTLRGPRAGLVFYRKELGDAINAAVFPGLQGGPHQNAIAAIAVQMKEVASPEWVEYAKAVVENARTLANDLVFMGYTIVTGGTDNHVFLWDLRPQGLGGSKLEALCDLVGITINKNAVPGDKSALSPGGVRIGTAAVTSMGYTTDHMHKVASHLNAAVKLALEIQQAAPGNLAAFKAEMTKDRWADSISALRIHL